MTSRESDAMLRAPIQVEHLKSDFYENHKRQKKRKICLSFCLGFTLSTILAIGFCGLTCTFLAYHNYFGLLSAISNKSIKPIPTILETDDFEPTLLSLPTTTTLLPSIPPEKCSKRVVAYHDLSSVVPENQFSKLTHLILKPEIHLQGDKYTFSNVTDRNELLTIIQEARKVPELKILFSSYLLLPSAHQDQMETRNLQELDKGLKNLAVSTKRKTPYIISGLVKPFEPLGNLEVMSHLDFLTISTIAFHFPSSSPENQSVGPPSPLYSQFASNHNNNVDYSMKQFSCSSQQPYKLNMMVDFSGNYWTNVFVTDDLLAPLWMMAQKKHGEVFGGRIAWSQPEFQNHIKSTVLWNDDSKTPYVWDPVERTYFAYENERSLGEKIKYANEKNIGGFAVWSLSDDDEKGTMMNVLGNAELCSGEDNTVVNYDC